jgi:hypothetical protein
MKKIIVLLAFALSITSLSAQDKPKCTATTKAGTQCKRNASPGAQYCKQHDPATPKCGAITKAGTPCKVSVKVAGDKCHNHAN